MTSVSSSAEPSQQVCSLQSASLPTQVILPFNCILSSWEQYMLCYLMEEVYKKKKAMTFTGYRSKSSIGISFH